MALTGKAIFIQSGIIQQLTTADTLQVSILDTVSGGLTIGNSVATSVGIASAGSACTSINIGTTNSVTAANVATGTGLTALNIGTGTTTGTIAIGTGMTAGGIVNIGGSAGVSSGATINLNANVNIAGVLTEIGTSSFREVVLFKGPVTFGLTSTATLDATMDGLTLPHTPIVVNSTDGFAATGTILVATTTGNQIVNYTGLTATSFTGCLGGDGVGTMATSGAVVESAGTDTVTFATGTRVNSNMNWAAGSNYAVGIFDNTTAGNGGSLTVHSGSGLADSGSGGDLLLGAGFGGDSTGASDGGAGGNVNIHAGSGGDGALVSTTPGATAIDLSLQHIQAHAIEVDSTEGFLASESETMTITVPKVGGGTMLVTYESITPTTFEGCTFSTGAPGQIAAGNAHQAYPGKDAAIATPMVGQLSSDIEDSVINVASAANFTSNGYLLVPITPGDHAVVRYSSKTATSFVGCTCSDSIPATATIKSGNICQVDNTADLNMQSDTAATTVDPIMDRMALSTPLPTFTVASTTGFASAGEFVVDTSADPVIVKYTGKSGTTFTGCTHPYTTWTLATGGAVSQTIQRAGLDISVIQGSIITVADTTGFDPTGATALSVPVATGAHIAVTYASIAGNTFVGCATESPGYTFEAGAVIGDYGPGQSSALDASLVGHVVGEITMQGIAVDHVAGFAAAGGTIYVPIAAGGTAAVSYTSTVTTPTFMFVGCSGGSGVIAAGAVADLEDPPPGAGGSINIIGGAAGAAPGSYTAAGGNISLQAGIGTGGSSNNGIILAGTTNHTSKISIGYGGNSVGALIESDNVTYKTTFKGNIDLYGELGTRVVSSIHFSPSITNYGLVVHDTTSGDGGGLDIYAGGAGVSGTGGAVQIKGGAAAGSLKAAGNVSLIGGNAVTSTTSTPGDIHLNPGTRPAGTQPLAFGQVFWGNAADGHPYLLAEIGGGGTDSSGIGFRVSPSRHVQFSDIQEGSTTWKDIASTPEGGVLPTSTEIGQVLVGTASSPTYWGGQNNIYLPGSGDRYISVLAPASAGKGRALIVSGGPAKNSDYDGGDLILAGGDLNLGGACNYGSVLLGETTTSNIVLGSGGLYDDEAQTTIDTLSNGDTCPGTGNKIYVASTTGFPSASLRLHVMTAAGLQTVAYTGKNPACATTIAVGSNIQTLPRTPGDGLIHAVSTTGFTTSGVIFVTTGDGVQTVAYTGIAGNDFTGCTGGTGTMSLGGAITQQASLTGCTGGSGMLLTGYRVGIGINKLVIGEGHETVYPIYIAGPDAHPAGIRYNDLTHKWQIQTTAAAWSDITAGSGVLPISAINYQVLQNLTGSAVWESNITLSGDDTGNRSISVQPPTASGAGKSLTVQSAAGTTEGAGGALNLTAGSGTGSSAHNGGALVITAGSGVGASGAAGGIVLDPGDGLATMPGFISIPAMSSPAVPSRMRVINVSTATADAGTSLLIASGDAATGYDGGSFYIRAGNSGDEDSVAGSLYLSPGSRVDDSINNSGHIFLGAGNWTTIPTTPSGVFLQHVATDGQGEYAVLEVPINGGDAGSNVNAIRAGKDIYYRFSGAGAGTRMLTIMDQPVGAGDNLTIQAGKGAATKGGGNVTINGGDVGAGGTPVAGSVYLGAAHTTSTIFGATNTWTFTNATGMLAPTGTANINLPNTEYGGTIFQIAGHSVDYRFTAANASTLVNGGDASALHTHTGVTTSSDVTVTVTNDGASVGNVVHTGTTDTITAATGAGTAAAAEVLGVKTATGKVMMTGVAAAIIEGTLVIAAGDKLYLSVTTAGTVTNVAPSTAGQFLVYLGIAKSGGTGGSGATTTLYLRPSRPLAL